MVNAILARAGIDVDHYGVEQAFRPAVKLIAKSALAAEVFSRLMVALNLFVVSD
jgi:hypothetical protein